MNLLHLLQQPWGWLFSGFVIALVMLTLLFFGNVFGLSTTYRTICTLAGAGKNIPFFKMDWRAQRWNLTFAAGIILGGWIAATFLLAKNGPMIAPATLEFLRNNGWTLDPASPNNAFLPPQLFGEEALLHISTWLKLIMGGILSGFGAQYGGGCTSGHFVSGLSNLQLPSLITLLFFFVGGIIMSNFIIPHLF